MTVKRSPTEHENGWILLDPHPQPLFSKEVTKSTKFKSSSVEPLRVLRAFVVNPIFSFLVAALPRQVSVVNIPFTAKPEDPMV
jgi:hypothetical protein